ncbi:hypothetical protein M433DRAFT_226822 [Acidomyces richmondensis BFW]|nr:MAG: hypothetical protein FE78DRAFT_376425 [Acidomyces sp. 'richmondensis']KYG46023.1 hypothetical protein M433DRAFT_226822 [Acidomyces richmondensis BFW]
MSSRFSRFSAAFAFAASSEAVVSKGDEGKICGGLLKARAKVVSAIQRLHVLNLCWPSDGTSIFYFPIHAWSQLELDCYACYVQEIHVDFPSAHLRICTLYFVVERSVFTPAL